MELCPKPMLPSGYCKVSQRDSPIILPSHLTCTIYRGVFVAKLHVVLQVTLVLHDAVVTAALQCTIWWRLSCMCCITFSSHSAVLNPTTSLLVTICFSTLRCTSIMSLFRASSICKPRPSHTSSLAQLLCPVIIGQMLPTYPCNVIHCFFFGRLDC